MRPSADEFNDPSDAPPPAPQPQGSLVPPPSKPPTAISAAADQPSWWLRRSKETWSSRGSFAELVNEIFDAVDGFADRVASTLGLR